MASSHQNPGRPAVPDRKVRLGVMLALVALCLGTVLTVQMLRPRSSNPPADERNPSAFATKDSEANPARLDLNSSARKFRPDVSSPPAELNQDAGQLLAALLRAQAVEDSIAREEALALIMEGVSAEMAATILARMNPEDLSGEAARQIFGRWAAGDPSRAAAWAQAQSNAELRQSLMNTAAVRWAETDLPGATAWARSLPATDRVAALAAVGMEAVRTDPLAALDLAVEMPAGAARDELARRAAAEWAVTDRDAAAQWAAQIPDETLRQQVTEQVAVAAAEHDPVAAARIALEQMPSGGEQDRVVVSIVLRWVQSDPQAAADWVTQFPEGAVRRDAVEGLVNLWADRDLTASGNWLLTLPEGDLRNTAIASYAHTLEPTDAALAQRWAALATP